MGGGEELKEDLGGHGGLGNNIKIYENFYKIS
jgi:hypothetical protein